VLDVDVTAAVVADFEFVVAVADVVTVVAVATFIVAAAFVVVDAADNAASVLVLYSLSCVEAAECVGAFAAAATAATLAAAAAMSGASFLFLREVVFADRLHDVDGRSGVSLGGHGCGSG
jgi:hypothetical protein